MMSLQKNLLKFLKNYAIAIASLVFILITLIFGSSRTSLYMYENVGIAMILAMSLSFVVGFLGELSLGHAGFMAIGAYLGGKIAVILFNNLHVNQYVVLILALLVGGITSAIAGFIIGLPALRLKGDYLAIVTLAFCEIVRVLFLNSSANTFCGADGLETPRWSYKTFYIIIFIVVILTVVVFQNFIRSKHGRAVTAIRDNEIAARATGVDVTRYKLIAFIISAFFAGIAGVLYSYTQSRVLSTHFDYNYSIDILVMVVFGGMGSMNGSAIAAIVITFLNEKLTTLLTGNLAVLQKVIYSLILIFIVIYTNAPGLRSFRERFNIRVLWTKLVKKKDPAEINNDEGSWDRIPTNIKMDEVLSTELTPQESVMDADKGGK